ncbi:hypothetical protein RRG08_029652 [Elysia crispata]|uniref:Uncharacterized protein n=1 Tax=Elysia crispata TaxID=231223 RepID=A0AAE1CJS1_9GAST|nr:hypothetical protein RRG08_029652 [Elysia crispata]
MFRAWQRRTNSMCSASVRQDVCEPGTRVKVQMAGLSGRRQESYKRANVRDCDKDAHKDAAGLRAPIVAVLWVLIDVQCSGISKDF